MTDRNQNDGPEEDIGLPRLVLPAFNDLDLVEAFRTGRRPEPTEEQLEALREMQAEIDDQREAAGILQADPEVLDRVARRVMEEQEGIHLNADPEALEQAAERYNAAVTATRMTEEQHEAMRVLREFAEEANVTADEGTRNEDEMPARTEEELSELEHAHAVIAKLQAILKTVMEPPLTTAIVVDVLESGNVMLALEGMFKEVTVVPEIRAMMMPGIQVMLDESSMTVTKLALKPYRTGMEGSVERILANGFVEVEVSGKLVKSINSANAEEGDLVILDKDGMAVIDVLPKDKSKFKLHTVTNMTWDDIGGLEEAKQDMVEAVQHPHMYPELHAKYGRDKTKGILLYGPPGCGKTMIARVCASVLADMYGRGTVDTGYIYVKGPEILSQWVGRAEQTIRELFESAREHKEKNGYPAVLFIDEADAVLGKRGSGISSDMEKTIVPMFLAEMDGLDDSGAFVILATNLADSLDPAVIRDGRIDRKVEIGRPTFAAAKDILTIHLKKIPIEGLDVDDLASKAAMFIFSENAAMTKVNMKDGTHKLFGLCNLLSGAMLQGIVQNGISSALNRDIASGSFSGFTEADLIAGVKRSLKQARGLNNKSELKEFVKPFKADVEGMEAV